MGASLVVSGSVLAAAGEFDPSFGMGSEGIGTKTIPFDFGGNLTDTPRSMALDPEGNIVVGGSASTSSGFKMVTARLTADGLGDYSFDTTNGDYKRSYSAANSSTAGYGLVATSNGPCLAGSSNGPFSSTAYAGCFGANQVDTHSVSAAEQIFAWSAATSNSWTLFGNDFFYVAGPRGSGDDEDFAVARLQLSPAGLALDPGFGQGGYAGHSTDMIRHQIKAIALTEDFGPYLAGCEIAAGGGFAVVKLLPSGDPDTTFDDDGLRHQYFAGAFDNCATAIAVDAEDRLVLAGITARDANGTDLDIALTRLMPNGNDDLSFGPDGERVYSFSTADPTLKDEVNGVAIDSLGRIYVVGTLYHADQQDDISDVAVLRLKPDGEIDTSFGVEGRAFFSGVSLPWCDTPISAEKGIAIVLQDLKPVILAEKHACQPDDTDFMVMRLLPGDGLFADGFEGP